MKKYLLVFSQSFSDLLAYRLSLFIELFKNSLPAFITLLVLTYAKSSSISSSALISYYLFVTVTAPLVISNIDEQLDVLANSGEINNFLTKPVTLVGMFWVKNISEKFLTFLLISPILLLLLKLLGISGLSLLVFFISLPISFTLSYFLSFIVGLGCFWLDEFWSIRNVKYVTIQLLGGLIIPYSIMPEKLLSFIRFTPFPYLGSWPGRILQGSVPVKELLFSLVWIIILYCLLIISQRSAIRHYSHTGS